jgi:hypothetical protein
MIGACSIVRLPNTTFHWLGFSRFFSVSFLSSLSLPLVLRLPFQKLYVFYQFVFISILVFILLIVICFALNAF